MIKESLWYDSICYTISRHSMIFIDLALSKLSSTKQSIMKVGVWNSWHILLIKIFWLNEIILMKKIRIKNLNGTEWNKIWMEQNLDEKNSNKKIRIKKIQMKKMSLCSTTSPEREMHAPAIFHD